MTERGEHLRQSDVTLWGVIALSCGALALLAGNLNTLLPANWMIGLHATRLEGGNLNALSAQVKVLERESVELRALTVAMNARLSIAAKTRSKTTQRVAALEYSIPALLEALPATANIDTSTLTASVENANGAPQEVDGGTVSVTTSPLFPQTGAGAAGTIGVAATTQPLPEVAVIAEPEGLVTQSGFGVAIGPTIEVSAAGDTWNELSGKIGTLLLGLEPLLAWNDMTGDRRIVAGPMAGYAQADQLCSLVMRAGIACLPAAYEGTALER